MQTKPVISYVSNWMKEYSNSCNSHGFVIGISGGIDSAVTSTLAAITELPIICVEMPINQNKTQINRAKKHIQWLKKNFQNVSSIKIELTSVFDEFTTKLPFTKNKLALANTRARPVSYAHLTLPTILLV